MQRDNPEIAKKYRSRRFRKARALYLATINYLCGRCTKNGTLNTAEICHHKEHITEQNYMDDELFFGFDNLEGLCRDCHNKEHFKNKDEYSFDENGDLIYEK